MHLTSQQLRTLRQPFEQAPSPPPTPPLQPYSEDRERVALLTILTSEANILNLAALYKSTQDPKPVEAAHQQIASLARANSYQVQLENIKKTIRRYPADLVDFCPSSGEVQFTKRGEAAVALGGFLLHDFSYKCGQRIRDWTGSRLLRRNQPNSTDATVQLHRVHILGHLLPEGACLTAQQLADRAEGELEYANALKTVKRMGEVGVLNKVRVSKYPLKFGWRLHPERRRPAEKFMATIADFSPLDSDSTAAGLEKIDYFFDPTKANISHILYWRGLLSIVEGGRNQPQAFNERLQTLFEQLEPGTLLSARQISEYLGEPVTIARLLRQVDRLGRGAAIECIEIPHPTGKQYRFGMRRPVLRET